MNASERSFHTSLPSQSSMFSRPVLTALHQHFRQLFPSSRSTQACSLCALWLFITVKIPRLVSILLLTLRWAYSGFSLQRSDLRAPDASFQNEQTPRRMGEGLLPMQYSWHNSSYEFERVGQTAHVPKASFCWAFNCLGQMTQNFQQASLKAVLRTHNCLAVTSWRQFRYYVNHCVPQSPPLWIRKDIALFSFH